MPNTGPDNTQETPSSELSPIIKILVVLGVILLFVTRPFVRFAGYVSGKFILRKWQKLTDKAAYLYNNENYDEAIIYSHKALNLIKNKFGDNNYYYIRPLISLGEYYRLKLEYERSEQNLYEALSLVEKGSDAYNEIQGILGNLFADQQKYKKSEESYLAALESIKQDQQDLRYKTIAFNMNTLYAEMGQSEKSKYYLEESHEHQKENKDEIDEAFYLSQKANHLFMEYKFSEAEELMLKSISIFEKTGQSGSFYVNALNDYANILLRQEKPMEAKRIAEKAFRIANIISGEKSITAIKMKVTIGVIDVSLSNYSEAEKYFQEALEYFSNSSFKCEKDYTNVLFNLFQLYWKKQDYSSSDKLFPQMIETYKNYYLNVSKDFNETERLHFYDSILSYSLSLYNYVVTRGSINYNLLVDIFNFRLFSKDLLPKEFEAGKSKIKHYSDIQNKLNDDEAAIEIIRFYHIDGLVQDQIYYIFIILTKETFEYPYATYYSCNSQTELKFFNNAFNAVSRKSLELDSFNNLWKGLEEFLSNKFRIYISPDGFYKKINFNSIFTSRGNFLLEEKEIIYVNDFNSFDFDKRTDFHFYSKKATLLGNPDFCPTDPSVYTKLPQTEVEISFIEEELKKNNWSVRTFLGGNALKQNLINGFSSELLHIATHGFYLETTNRVIEIEGVMDNSGLLLTNSVSKEENEVIFNKDGMITAREISRMDLSHVRLVVLSACNSGSGMLINSGDLFGLQRAFFSAGVDSLIVSLFKVPDEATRELMTEFYRRLLINGDEIKSFRDAQLSIKSKHRYPFYWGGFILVNNQSL